MARIHQWETNAAVLQEMIGEGGFCSQHAAALLGIGSPVSVSAIAAGLTERFAERIGSENRVALAENGCYLCLILKQAAGSILTEIEEALNSTAFRDAYLESAGLCLPHLYELMARVKRDDLRAFLIEATGLQLRRFAGLCRSYREKRQHLRRDQITLDEKWAWLTAIEKLFGHEEAIRLP